MRWRPISHILLVAVASFWGIEISWSFSVPIHREITMETVGDMTADVSGQPAMFSDRALEALADANERVDSTRSSALFFPMRHFTNEDYANASRLLTQFKRDILIALRLSTPDGFTARRLLGRALHTVQDFYSHSNWVELGNSNINMNLGRNILANPPRTLQACPNDRNILGPNGGGDDTSGYYVGITLNRNTFGCVEDKLPAPGKCFHGNYKLTCIGINKDLDAAGAMTEGIPMSVHHPEARRLAELATADYVEQILFEIRGNDKAIAALLDLRGTVGFVIDDTGSMGTEIDGVKAVVANIVNTVNSNPRFKPDNFLLVRFGDPDVGSAFVTDTADALLNAVNALGASGGGDCPEFSQAALLEAINKSLPNSRLYLFTDASAKDTQLGNLVISEAQKKGTKIFYQLTGTCSPVDEAYVRGAEETGGQLFFIDQVEVPLLFDLIVPQLSGDLVTILSRKGGLTTVPRIVDVPVDSTIMRLVVSVSNNPQVDLVDFYSFSGRAGDTIVAEINASRVGSSLDSILTLFSTDGTTVLARNDDFFGLDSRIEITLPRDGTYFLRVVDFSGEGGANFFYSLTLEANDALLIDLGDEAEPNDSSTTATPIGFGNIISGTISGISVVSGNVALRRPSGEPVSPSDPDAQIIELSSGSVFMIAEPEQGPWQVEIARSVGFSMMADGNSPIDFHRFDFVEANEDIHGGFFPIPGQPLAGAESMGEASLLGPFDTATFRLVDENGETIREIDLEQNFPRAVRDHFLGVFELPGVPFRVMATGNDSSGFQYQRQFPTVYRAQTVGVHVDDESDGTIPAGETTTRNFTVVNLGDAADFHVDVFDTLGFVTGVSSTVLSLEAGATDILNVDVSVPEDTPDGTELAVTTTATQTGDSTVFNSATVNLIVASTPSDLDDDGVPDDEDQCPNSDLSDTVLIDRCDSGVTNHLAENGCTFSDQIAECAEGATNHGKFVSCVAHLTNDLKKAGSMTGEEKGAIQVCAAQGDIP